MSSSLPPLLPHATRDLARFAAATRYADIPAAVDNPNLSTAGFTATLPLSSVPVGLSGDGMPIALQLQGARVNGGAAALHDQTGLARGRWKIYPGCLPVQGSLGGQGIPGTLADDHAEIGVV